MSSEFILKTTRNNILRISAFGINNLLNAPCLIFVHGFKGFKDWGFWKFSANYFAERGYFVLTFNFSHNGIGEDPLEFTEPEKFASNTFSLEVEELNEIINNYSKGFFGQTENNLIGITGHSRGGAVSILTAAENRRVSALCTWASISKIDRYTERQKGEWRSKGYLEVMNSRTGQMMRMNAELLEDIERNKDGSLNIEKATGGLRIPYLIIHGEQDVTVPVKEAEQLYKWSDKTTSEMEVIQSAGHTFNIVHPFTGSNDKFDKVLKLTEKFFNKTLIKEN